jgi:3-methyladenine DNA glycosylase AlkD
MTFLEDIRKDLLRAADSQKAKKLANFFKTGKGQYGEGDVFLGITVPKQRKIARKYIDLHLEDIQVLLGSEVHEHRLTALIILVSKFEKANDMAKEKIFHFFLDNMEHINNWDLVDLSAPKIVGEYLFDKNRSILFRLAKSSSLWERRIAVLSTFYFIKNNDFKDSLAISELLLDDEHDLIHKAVGWMLREIGKRDQKLLENFIEKHCLHMPRTMLRYAIEKFDKDKRKFYLTRKI